MIIIDKPLQKKIRDVGRCLWCGRSVPTECCHLTAKGNGGGFQLDVRWNLWSGCHECHMNQHAGHVLVDDGKADGDPDAKDCLMARVAKREKTTKQAVREAIYLLRRIDKHDSDEKVQRKLAELEPGPRGLAQRVLEEVRRS